MWWLLRIDLIVRFPLQLSYSRSMTSFWLLPLQASGSLPWTTAPPSHNISSVALCLISGTPSWAMYWTAEGSDWGAQAGVVSKGHYGGVPADILTLSAGACAESLKWGHPGVKRNCVKGKIEGVWLKLYSSWLISHILLIGVSEVHCHMSGSHLQSIPRWNWKLRISIWNSQRSKHTFLSRIWIMQECSPSFTRQTHGEQARIEEEQRVSQDKRLLHISWHHLLTKYFGFVIFIIVGTTWAWRSLLMWVSEDLSTTDTCTVRPDDSSLMSTKCSPE